MRWHILFLFWGLFTSVYSQTSSKNTPQESKISFASPLNIPLVASGTFGELRSNHFHSGLDLKTKQQTGLPIYAPSDGFVSRIKIAHFGYGKALYIQHPEGFFTVYAHLEKYADAIQTHVLKKQYSKEVFEIELFPAQQGDSLFVKKGDIIGYTGNSGGSAGPHLHFEIRDAHQRPLNPLNFGIKVKDTRKPKIKALYAYALDTESKLNSTHKRRIKLRLIPQQDGTYKTNKLKATGNIGFGVAVTDQQDFAPNKNGIYSIETTYNGEALFKVTFDRLSFSETRYINDYIDYPLFVEEKVRVQKLFRTNYNPLSIIETNFNEGSLKITEGYHGHLKINIRDFAGNSQQIFIPIEGSLNSVDYSSIPKEKEVEETHDKTHKQLLKAKLTNTFSFKNFSVNIPKGALYQDISTDIYAKADTLFLGNSKIPLHKSIRITANVNNYKDTDLSKLFLGLVRYNYEPQYLSTQLKNNTLIAYTKEMGKIVIASDTTKPKIKPVNFTDGKWLSNHQKLQLKIEDQHTGIGAYRGTLNGKFALFEYDPKTHMLTHFFSDGISQNGKNNLKVVVLDNVGNSTTFEASFFRKQE